MNKTKGVDSQDSQVLLLRTFKTSDPGVNTQRVDKLDKNNQSTAQYHKDWQAKYSKKADKVKQSK